MAIKPTYEALEQRVKGLEKGGGPQRLDNLRDELSYSPEV